MLFRSFFLLIFVRLLLSFLSLGKFKKVIAHMASKTPSKDYQIFIGYFKKWGNRFPRIFTCLVQASSLRLLLGDSMKHIIHFGIKKDPRFAAHAWVEMNGKVVLGEEHYKSYKRIWSW